MKNKEKQNSQSRSDLEGIGGTIMAGLLIILAIKGLSAFFSEKPKEHRSIADEKESDLINKIIGEDSL